MTEQCKGDGSIQKLVANKWKTVGIGQLFLLKNKHNPTQVLIKLIRTKRNEVHIFQCKPKVKPNGKSLILKGTDTKKKQEFVLAVRFNQDFTMQQFQTTLDKLYRRNQSISAPSRHKRQASKPPKELRIELSQYAWDCPICTYRNEPTVFDCEVCKTPRPLKKRESGLPIIHANVDSALPDNLPPVFTPKASDINTPINGNGTKSNSKERPFPDIQENEALETKEDADEIVMINDEYEKDEAESKEDDVEEKSDSQPSSQPVLGNKMSKEEEQKSSIKELIIKVTNGEEISGIKHNEVEAVLLLCHDVFTDSETMLTILLDRLCDKELIDVNARIRGVKMCESWIRNYWEADFQNNDKMMDIVYGFIDDLSDSSANSKTAHLTDSDIKLLSRIKNTFNQKANSFEIEKKRKMAKVRSVKILGAIDIPKNYDVMAETAEVIAQQITLMDFALFQSIEKREMCGQGWKKKDRESRSPHLLEMIKQFNQISKWVQCVVLQQKNKKKRTKCIEKFIDIAVHLKELRNFSACCAINFGLSANVLYRLKDAWNSVGKQQLKQYAEIQLIYKGKKNWELLRVLHKNAHAPSILHTGLFLQDLLNTDEGNDDTRKDGTVNFGKLKQTYNLIEQICMYQQSQYFKIKTNHIMQQYLRQIWKKQESYNDDKMYKISTIIKNKDAEGKDIEQSDLVLIAW